MTSVSDLIYKYVSLGKVSSTGYHNLKCPICRDYKERFGISFNNSEIWANCFNCGFSVRYNESSQKVSRKFKELLIALGVPEDEIVRNDQLKFFEPVQEVISTASLQKLNLHTPETTLPLLSVQVRADNFPEINEYLQARKIDINEYPFFGSLDKMFRNRVIIPFYKYGKLIYWQARSIDDNKRRYINCEVSKAAVVFNGDSCMTKCLTPVYATEGVFDAMGVNGISIIGSKLNKEKIEILRQSRRPLIFVLDTDNNGLLLGEQVIQYNLGNITRLAKGLDINKSIIQYGKLYTYYQLNQNICRTDFEKQLLLNNLRASLK